MELKKYAVPSSSINRRPACAGLRSQAGTTRCRCPRRVQRRLKRALRGAMSQRCARSRDPAHKAVALLHSRGGISGAMKSRVTDPRREGSRGLQATDLDLSFERTFKIIVAGSWPQCAQEIASRPRRERRSPGVFLRSFSPVPGASCRLQVA